MATNGKMAKDVKMNVRYWRLKRIKSIKVLPQEHNKKNVLESFVASLQNNSNQPGWPGMERRGCGGAALNFINPTVGNSFLLGLFLTSSRAKVKKWMSRPVTIINELMTCKMCNKELPSSADLHHFYHHVCLSRSRQRYQTRHLSAACSHCGVTRLSGKLFSFTQLTECCAPADGRDAALWSIFK